MSALIQFLSISLDLDKFQITCKAGTYHSGSFGPNTGNTGSNNVSKGMCLGYWCIVMYSSLKICLDEMGWL